MSKSRTGGRLIPVLPAIQLAPLTPALCLDVSIPAGRSGPIQASRFVWVLPRGRDGWVRSLETLITTN